MNKEEQDVAQTDNTQKTTPVKDTARDDFTISERDGQKKLMDIKEQGTWKAEHPVDLKTNTDDDPLYNFPKAKKQRKKPKVHMMPPHLRTLDRRNKMSKHKCALCRFRRKCKKKHTRGRDC